MTFSTAPVEAFKRPLPQPRNLACRILLSAVKIVIGHHPIYSCGQHGDTPYIVEHILPLSGGPQGAAYLGG